MSIQRIIYKDGVEESTPKLPFVVVKNDGIVGEADSIRGIISIIIPEYLDAEDSLDDWNLRVRYARKQAMFALDRNIDIVVYDREKGIINNNYAAASDDEDYEMPADITNFEKIYVDKEKDFIKSLNRLGFIKLLERDDINIFSNDLEIKCDKCDHCKDGVCNLYNAEIDKVNSNCESGIDKIKEINGESYKFIE